MKALAEQCMKLRILPAEALGLCQEARPILDAKGWKEHPRPSSS